MTRTLTGKTILVSGGSRSIGLAIALREAVTAFGGIDVVLNNASADQGIAANSLWPRTTIGTAAIRNLLGGEAAVQKARTPDIMADAAHAILTRGSRTCTGNFYTDEDVLREEGVTDFSGYRLGDREEDLDLDFFLPDAPLPERP